MLIISEEEAKDQEDIKDDDFMVNNFRPPVPIGNRQLREM